MLRGLILALVCGFIANVAELRAQALRDPGRGELLYSTHCIACHTGQVHWRHNSIVTDWQSLQSQVRRWQDVSGLGWSEEDIAEVSRYLNARHYDYSAPQ